jgi:hypothetical protein
MPRRRPPHSGLLREEEMAALFVIELILGLVFVAVFGLLRLQDQIPRYPSHCSPFPDDGEEDEHHD